MAETHAAAVAGLLGAELRGPDVTLSGVCTLGRIRSHCLTFATNLSQAQAGALNATPDTLVMVTPALAHLLSAAPHIVLDNPRLGYAKAAQAFFAVRPTGVAATARVDPTARIGVHGSIGDYVVIEHDVSIGDHCHIDHHAVIKHGTRLGDHCSVGAHSSLGTTGFGLEYDTDGTPVRLPHLGGIAIGNYVEIGANTVIARGTIEDTHISDHVKIDDHVFIAHNVQIGEGSFVIACAQISGSVVLGKRVWVAPQVTILNKVKVGDNATLGIGAVVRKDVEAGTTVVGNPARVLAPRIP